MLRRGVKRHSRSSGTLSRGLTGAAFARAKVGAREFGRRDQGTAREEARERGASLTAQQPFSPRIFDAKSRFHAEVDGHDTSDMRNVPKREKREKEHGGDTCDRTIFTSTVNRKAHTCNSLCLFRAEIRSRRLDPKCPSPAEFYCIRRWMSTEKKRTESKATPENRPVAATFLSGSIARCAIFHYATRRISGREKDIRRSHAKVPKYKRKYGNDLGKWSSCGSVASVSLINTRSKTG